MRGRGHSLVVMLVVSAALLGGIVLSHIHDSSAAGLYDAQCPFSEFARHTSGLSLLSPDVASLERAPVAAPVAVDAQPTEDLPVTASPRAPPLG